MVSWVQHIDRDILLSYIIWDCSETFGIPLQISCTTAHEENIPEIEIEEMSNSMNRTSDLSVLYILHEDASSPPPDANPSHLDAHTIQIPLLYNHYSLK
jgi:hypothetical protein